MKIVNSSETIGSRGISAMKLRKTEDGCDEKDSPILQNSVPVKMLAACVLSCAVGIALMGALSHYLLMAIFVCILIAIMINTALLMKGKISLYTACLAPMLILCFVYTPISWFTFDGLIGCTPYLSILFVTVIILTYYSKTQAVLLSLYCGMMLGLTIFWCVTEAELVGTERIINVLIAYLITIAVNILIIEGVKRRNLEVKKQIIDLSLRDDLSGLLNRRAVEQVLGKLELDYTRENVEYAVILMDVDKFKSINDLFGHNLGDSVLKNISESILASIRSVDYGFRYGGDEFLIILPQVNRETAEKICKRIEASLRGVQGYAFELSVSTGCAMRSESANAAETVNLADQRMYECKRNQSSAASPAGKTGADSQKNEHAE